ncbi:hypothetical protein ACH4TV_05455 [Streptomyces sp. NPDC020898]|uniref:hypothetical protein n=1 Tax=Streptomyces sp. NPDC020898 TaxID=3365101 RepID=UPI003792DBDB
MRVHNDSGRRLELILEPYGSDHWLMPGETFVVVTDGSPAEPFQVDCAAGSMTVHVHGGMGWVEDTDGNEVECAHQRPPAAESGRRGGAFGRVVRRLRTGSS